MANRSDFFSAKLPRYLKRMLASAEANGWVKDAHERGSIRRQFIAAHSNHVSYKMKRQSADNVGASEET